MGLNAAARSDSATEKLLATDAGREVPDCTGRPDRETAGARATDGGREVDVRGSDAVDGPRPIEGLRGGLPLADGNGFLFVGGERLTLGERRLTAGARAGDGFFAMNLA